ncbi:lipase [Streptomyces sp. A7024]|uniref:Lipase n=1 Tax=Streptomyces coryli TaxID=1128680 RepID=A0A6G4TXD8_9ACTN|nr:lipase family protein [Streptomyces coryli]NGN63671.1 lipase [Streptomyces coryli]
MSRKLAAIAAALGLAFALPATGIADAAPTASAAAPGDLVTTSSTDFRTLNPQLSKAWHIEYGSTSGTDKPNTVSGTVIVPRDGRTGTRPLITYAVGTVGIDDSCAPSAGFPYGTTLEGNLIAQAIQRGYAVAVTDYEGLGTPGDHTYTVGRAAGTAMLDAARAAQKVPGARAAGVNENSPVGIMGYSQGGQAASWAAQLHKAYAPELKVKGTATGGVPADLMKAAEFNDGGLGSGLILMAAVGQNAAFPELKLDSYLNDRGRSLVGTIKKNCVAVNAVAGAFTKITDVTTKNPLEQPDWQARLAESKLGGTAPDAPVYLYHAQNDELIPRALGEGLRADWCAKGAPVSYKTIPVLEHVSGVIAETPSALSWLGDRFAGKPAAGNCG